MRYFDLLLLAPLVAAISTVTEEVVVVQKRIHRDCQSRSYSCPHSHSQAPRSRHPMSTITEGGRQGLVWCTTSFIGMSSHKTAVVTPTTSYAETVAILTAPGVTITTRIQIPQYSMSLTTSESVPVSESAPVEKDQGQDREQDQEQDQGQSIKRPRRGHRVVTVSKKCKPSRTTQTVVSTCTRTQTAVSTCTRTQIVTSTCTHTTISTCSGTKQPEQRGQMTTQTTTAGRRAIVFVRPVRTENSPTASVPALSTVSKDGKTIVITLGSSSTMAATQTIGTSARTTATQTIASASGNAATTARGQVVTITPTKTDSLAIPTMTRTSTTQPPRFENTPSWWREWRDRVQQKLKRVTVTTTIGKTTAQTESRTTTNTTVTVTLSPSPGQPQGDDLSDDPVHRRHRQYEEDLL